MFARTAREGVRRAVGAATRRGMAAAAGSGKRNPPNLEHIYSRVSLARQPSPIRAITPLVTLPGMISLGGGLPNPATFPFERVSVQLRDGATLTLEGAALSAALQYSPTPGLPALVSSEYGLAALQERVHSPPPLDEPRRVVVTTGSQDALTKCFEMLLNDGDAVLVEMPTYSGALAALQPHGHELVAVPTDAGGIVPEQLDELLSSWPDDRARAKPRVLYTIPTGQNPSGATQSEARKRALYAVCSRHDVIILEDDPYFYLQFDVDARAGKYPPSLMAMDIDGRVLRLDSFSKILSSGLRIGFVTGPAPLVERIDLHQQATQLHASGMSQAMVAELLRYWGADGWNAHVDSVQKLYRAKRDTFMALCEKHLAGVASWSAPAAGMFVWFKLHGVADSQALIMNMAREHKVLLVPGQAFCPHGNPSPYVRASFSLATKPDMDEALRRLRKGLDENARASK